MFIHLCHLENLSFMLSPITYTFSFIKENISNISFDWLKWPTFDWLTWPTFDWFKFELLAWPTFNRFELEWPSFKWSTLKNG
jgi:hypothetical protein